MSLREKQHHFLLEICKLVQWADKQGFMVTGGDLYRDPRVFGMYGDRRGYGASRSQHKRRLAIDLNLFKKDKAGEWEYCAATEDHTPLGEKWEAMGHVWGGRFNDGNHYQYE